MSKLCPKCQYFVGAPLLSSTALILLGMEFTRAAQVVAGILFHSSIMTSRSCWMLDTWCFSTFHLRMPHMCSIGFRSGDILGHSITFTISFSSKAVVILAVCLGVVVMLENSFWREGIIFCFRMSQYMLESMFPSMNRSSPVPAVLMQPQTMMLPPPCLTEGKTQFSWYSSPGCCHTCWNKQVYLRLIRPQDMVLVIHALGQVVFSKLFAGFFVSQLQKRLPPGTTAMQTDLLQCVAYGLSTDKLTFHLWNL